MEPFEFVFDYIISLFDFIKNTSLKAFVQIAAMVVFTMIILAIIFGVCRLIIWGALKH